MLRCDSGGKSAQRRRRCISTAFDLACGVFAESRLVQKRMTTGSAGAVEASVAHSALAFFAVVLAERPEALLLPADPMPL